MRTLYVRYLYLKILPTCTGNCHLIGQSGESLGSKNIYFFLYCILCHAIENIVKKSILSLFCSSLKTDRAILPYIYNTHFQGKKLELLRIKNGYRCLIFLLSWYSVQNCFVFILEQKLNEVCHFELIKHKLYGNNEYSEITSNDH